MNIECNIATLSIFRKTALKTKGTQHIENGEQLFSCLNGRKIMRHKLSPEFRQRQKLIQGVQIHPGHQGKNCHIRQPPTAKILKAEKTQLGTNHETLTMHK